MKKVLAILASLGLTTTAGLSVVACGKSNTQFNNFMSYVNETKGSYDDQGQPKTKSSASVIYIGAKDNGSSQSFEYALTKIFGSVANAKTTLNKENEVTKTNVYPFTKNIIDSKFQLTTAEAANLRNSDKIKVEVEQPNIDSWSIYDAIISSQPIGGNYTISIENFPNDSSNVSLKLTGYKVKTNSQTPSKSKAVVDGWKTAYNQWITRKNADRGIQGVDLNLDVNSDKFGKVKTLNKAEPVYGINRGGADTGLTTTAWDYAKIKFSLKTLTVDKVSNYWNNDLFNKISDNYLKKDLMYQLTANQPPTEVGRGDRFWERKTKVEEYISDIKTAKGPLFLIIKNGHVIKIMKGWNLYNKFASNGQDLEEVLKNDLIKWTNEMQTIFSSSFAENNSKLFNNGDNPAVDVWNFAKEKDDKGESNWDPKKEKPTK